MTKLMKAMTKIASCMVAIFVICSQSAFGGENDSTEIGRELIQAEPRIIGGNEVNEGFLSRRNFARSTF